METVIHARVSEKLLSKADRLFTGTLDGRIIEILQNARRAGATEVHIVNSEGQVTVRDNGQGIADFAALLDLGKSGWDDRTENTEDPAGVGIFCLAPREVCIASGHEQAVIQDKGWTGAPVQVLATQECVQGTALVFQDEPWVLETVQRHAVFTGLIVVVDDQKCDSEPFVSEHAVSHSTLGCRIEVRERSTLGQWHSSWKNSYHADNVLVNFHGQVVPFTFEPVSERLQFLVDLSGGPTSIRLMLPARTRLVENEALERLKAAIEREAYRYIQKRGTHKLKFSEYTRAKELHIELPEAEPVFQVGLLTGDPVEPVEVKKPVDLPLAKCYRLSPVCRDADACNEDNVHLLSALGKFEEAFVIVAIASDYDGYNWAKLPVVESVEVQVGQELHQDHLWCEALVAVKSLQLTARTSDRKTFSAEMPMAIRDHTRRDGRGTWVATDVLVTPAARERLCDTNIWYHLGGWSEDGDTYDTQLTDFREQLDQFWADSIGPKEYLRQRLFHCLQDFRIDWEHVSIHRNGKVWISHKDGTAEVLQPPDVSSSS